VTGKICSLGILLARSAGEGWNYSRGENSPFPYKSLPVGDMKEAKVSENPNNCTFPWIAGVSAFYFGVVKDCFQETFEDPSLQSFSPWISCSACAVSFVISDTITDLVTYLAYLLICMLIFGKSVAFLLVCRWWMLCKNIKCLFKTRSTCDLICVVISFVCLMLRYG